MIFPITTNECSRWRSDVWGGMSGSKAISNGRRGRTGWGNLPVMFAFDAFASHALLRGTPCRAVRHYRTTNAMKWENWFSRVMSIRLYDCLLASAVPSAGDELLIFLFHALSPHTTRPRRIFCLFVICVFSPRLLPLVCSPNDSRGKLHVTASMVESTGIWSFLIHIVSVT